MCRNTLEFFLCWYSHSVHSQITLPSGPRPLRALDLTYSCSTRRTRIKKRIRINKTCLIQIISNNLNIKNIDGLSWWLMKEVMFFLDMLSVSVTSIENCLAKFTMKLDSTMFLLYMLGDMVLLSSCIVTLSTLPKFLPSYIHTFVHLARDHSFHG